MLLNMDKFTQKMVYVTVEKDVCLNTTGVAKKHFTAVRTVTTDRQYLPTMCIFNDRPEPKDVVLFKGWVIKMNNGIWINEKVMLQWGQRCSESLHTVVPFFAGYGLILGEYHKGSRQS